MLASTAGQINCVGGVNGDNPTEISASDVEAVVAALFNQNAYTIADKIQGENRFGTAPVRNAFFAMGNSNLIRSLNNVDGFTHSSQYPSQMNILESEWGAVGNMRFLLSSIGSITPNASYNNATVYNTFVAGMESYGCIKQDRYSATFIYLPPEFSGPLALNASLGWKFAETPRILNDAWIVNMRSTI